LLTFSTSSSPESAAMNEPRKDFVLVAVDHKLYAIAGQDENKVMYTMECFDIAKNEWEFKCPLDRHLYNLILTAIIFATTCIHKIVNNNDRWII
jgi:hypothetical protein